MKYKLSPLFDKLSMRTRFGWHEKRRRLGMMTNSLLKIDFLSLLNGLHLGMPSSELAIVITSCNCTTGVPERPSGGPLKP